MKKPFVKKPAGTFALFEKSAQIALAAASGLQAALSGGVIEQSALVNVSEAQHAGETHLRGCLSAIDEAFITPFDRGGMVAIFRSFADITAGLAKVSGHIVMMRVRLPDSGLRRLSQLAVLSCQCLCSLMSSLKDYKKSREQLSGHILEIARLREEGAQCYFGAMQALFSHEANPVEIIRRKELYALLARTLDCCKAASDQVQAVLITEA